MAEWLSPFPDSFNLKWYPRIERLRHKREQKGTEKEIEILQFHKKESERIRNTVLYSAGFRNPEPYHLNGVHPLIRNWIRFIQLEIWKWQIMCSILLWPEYMQRGWREAFAEVKLQKYIKHTWRKYLGLPPPNETRTPFHFD